MLIFLILTDSLLKIYERMSERYERYNSSGKCFPDFKNFSQVWTWLSDEWSKQRKNKFQGGGAGIINTTERKNEVKNSVKNAARTLQCT